MAFYVRDVINWVGIALIAILAIIFVIEIICL